MPFIGLPAKGMLGTPHANQMGIQRSAPPTTGLTPTRPSAQARESCTNKSLLKFGEGEGVGGFPAPGKLGFCAGWGEKGKGRV